MDVMGNANRAVSVINLAGSLQKFNNYSKSVSANMPNKMLNGRTAFVISQEGYMQNPLKSSRESYIKMCNNLSENDPLMRNLLCGVTEYWYYNSIMQCMTTHFDARCMASCVMHKLARNTRSVQESDSEF
jgi:hypothetical protein